MRNRSSAIVVATLMMIGGLVFGAAPAAADPPEIRFENLCGAVGFSWDTGTIGDDDVWPTTVLRNGAVTEEFEMQFRGDREYGARDGDLFEMRREGLAPSSYLHRSPEGCTGTSLLTVVPTSGCTALTLTFDSDGAAPVSGLQVLAAGPVPQDVEPLGPGRTRLDIPLPDGAAFWVRGPLVGGGWATWLTGTYQRPVDCAVDPSPSPSAEPSPSEEPTATPTPGGAPGAGGGLPVTGAGTVRVFAVGLVLVGVGVALFLAAHRLRTAADRF